VRKPHEAESAGALGREAPSHPRTRFRASATAFPQFRFGSSVSLRSPEAAPPFLAPPTERCARGRSFTRCPMPHMTEPLLCDECFEGVPA
jgi:hypothetical protein